MLIDVDKYPCRQCEKRYCYQNCDKFNDWLNTPIKYDVVYCKDCKYWADLYHCPMVMIGEYDDEIIINATKDGFCDRGVRK